MSCTTGCAVMQLSALDFHQSPHSLFGPCSEQIFVWRCQLWWACNIKHTHQDLEWTRWCFADPHTRQGGTTTLFPRSPWATDSNKSKWARWLRSSYDRRAQSYGDKAAPWFFISSNSPTLLCQRKHYTELKSRYCATLMIKSFTSNGSVQKLG